MRLWGRMTANHREHDGLWLWIPGRAIGPRFAAWWLARDDVWREIDKAFRSFLLHRPDRVGDRSLRREDGDELAADILQQHRVGIVVLAHLVEFHALPGHDGLL